MIRHELENFFGVVMIVRLYVVKFLFLDPIGFSVRQHLHSCAYWEVLSSREVTLVIAHFARRATRAKTRWRPQTRRCCKKRCSKDTFKGKLIFYYFIIYFLLSINTACIRSFSVIFTYISWHFCCNLNFYYFFKFWREWEAPCGWDNLSKRVTKLGGDRYLTAVWIFLIQMWTTLLVIVMLISFYSLGAEREWCLCV